MVFSPGDAVGQAIIVPTQARIESASDLRAEAEALWQAEDQGAKAGALSKSWGAAGALFLGQEAAKVLSGPWATSFKQAGSKTCSVVDSNGIMDLGEISGCDAVPLDFDILLATATRPDPARPSVGALAGAWASQEAGYEEYFFNNVRDGIRTPDDHDIWHGLRSQAPRHWFEKYHAAISTLE
jgi:hypothetical protein